MPSRCGSRARCRPPWPPRCSQQAGADLAVVAPGLLVRQHQLGDGQPVRSADAPAARPPSGTGTAGRRSRSARRVGLRLAPRRRRSRRRPSSRSRSCSALARRRRRRVKRMPLGWRGSVSRWRKRGRAASSNGDGVPAERACSGRRSRTARHERVGGVGVDLVRPLALGPGDRLVGGVALAGQRQRAVERGLDPARVRSSRPMRLELAQEALRRPASAPPCASWTGRCRS